MTLGHVIELIKDALTPVKSDITTIKEKTDWVTPQQYGAKGDGVTDDTQAFQALNGKCAFVPAGTYRISSVVYGSNTVINGAGMDKAIIKQTQNCGDDMICFVDASGSALTNITLLGCGGEEQETLEHDYYFQALLKSYNVQDPFAERCLFEHLSIRNAPVNGFVLQGQQSLTAGEFDPRLYDERHLETKYNFVHQINDLRIEGCYRWNLIDSGTDNRWSNLYLSDGDVGCFFMHNASSNMYVNIKIDQPYLLGTSGSYDGFVDGAGLLMLNCYSDTLTNLDVQSSVYVGIKMHNCRGDRLAGILNNTGRVNVFQGVGMVIDDSYQCELNFEFHRVNHESLYNCIINNNNNDVIVYMHERNTAPSVNNSPNTCSIINIANKLSKVFNASFNVNLTMTNLLNSPLCEDANDWRGYPTIDTTGKVAGNNSFVINDTVGEYKMVAQKVYDLEPGAIYLAAFAFYTETENPNHLLPSLLLVDSDGQSIVTPTSEGGMASFSFGTDQGQTSVVNKHVRLNIFKAPDDGYVDFRVTNSSAKMKIYVGNFMLTKLTGNIIESKMNEDFYREMYEILTDDYNNSFSTSDITYSVNCSDMMGMLKMLMSNNS